MQRNLRKKCKNKNKINKVKYDGAWHHTMIVLHAKKVK